MKIKCGESYEASVENLFNQLESPYNGCSERITYYGLEVKRSQNFFEDLDDEDLNTESTTYFNIHNQGVLECCDGESIVFLKYIAANNKENDIFVFMNEDISDEVKEFSNMRFTRHETEILLGQPIDEVKL